MKVWGVGLGRTGTKSLCNSLEILGFNVMHNPPHFHQFEELEGAAEGLPAIFYKHLDVRFPESKFVLTTRELRGWLKSNKKAIEELYPLDRVDESSEYYPLVIRNRAYRFGCLDYQEETLVHRYYEHHHQVTNYFINRPDKLLVMDIIQGDGWEELCYFLELPVPDVPFPRILAAGHEAKSVLDRSN